MENTSKNFVLQLGALVSLYATLSAVVTLMFGVITLAFPDAADQYWEYEGAQSMVRFGIASLIVFFPTYLVLTRMVNQIRRTEHGVYLTLTRWLIYLSLFVGGAILLGDLVAVILSFLNGEITTRFLLKAATLFVVIGAALWYYILDARGHWNTHEKRSKQVGLMATVAAVGAIVLGLINIDMPAEVREQRLDDQQITDLQDMQYRIEDYYQMNNALPENVMPLYVTGNVPTAPEDRAAYQYRVTGARSYELCANFAQPSPDDVRESYARPMFDVDVSYHNYNWEHEAGEFCFTRTIPEEQGTAGAQ